MEGFNQHFRQYRNEIAKELAFANMSKHATKDIIIIVHDQLPYIKSCIDSILKTTENYNLHIWDNNSKADTAKYLQDLDSNYFNIHVTRSFDNMGFIKPNNRLVQEGSAEYIILLNSDVIVFNGWDKSMTGFLQNNSDVVQIGHQGGLLDEKGLGGRIGFGYEIDYVCGWCSCISRKTYQEYGLFDPKLQFAYAEDSELSIRLQESGKKIYALHNVLAHHYQNKTISEVFEKEKDIDLVKTFDHNHEYLRAKHKDYLANKRVDTRKESKC